MKRKSHKTLNSGIFEDWAKKNQIVLGSYACHLMSFNSLSLKGGIKDSQDSKYLGNSTFQCVHKC